MKAKQLIDLLSAIEPDTELGVILGYRHADLKSMDVIGNKLYLTGGNWAPTQEEQNKFNFNCIVSSLAHFAKKSDYERGYEDAMKKIQSNHEQELQTTS